MKRSHRAWFPGSRGDCEVLPASGTSHSPLPHVPDSHAPRPGLPRRPHPAASDPPPPQTCSRDSAPFRRLRRACHEDAPFTNRSKPQTADILPVTSDLWRQRNWDGAEGGSRKFCAGGWGLRDHTGGFAFAFPGPWMPTVKN